MALNAAEQAEDPEKSSLKILVVDDDELNTRMMRLLLTREEHEVVVAADGMEALEAVKSHRFDVIFMDLQMPVMDGIETSRRIREWENGGGHTYIVALTASYLPEAGQVMFEAGIDNYIAKPFEVAHIQRLLGLIRENRRPVQPELQALPAVPATTDEVLDVQKGSLFTGGDPDTYMDLLNDFLQELPDRIGRLEQFSRDRELTSLARAAHNLKGVSSNLGALQLSAYADKLDRLSNEGYTESIQALILDIKRAEINLQEAAADFLTNHDRKVAST